MGTKIKTIDEHLEDIIRECYFKDGLVELLGEARHTIQALKMQIDHHKQMYEHLVKLNLPDFKLTPVNLSGDEQAELKACSNCRHLDEHFGDCVHPKSGGSVDQNAAIKYCITQDMAWWENNENPLVSDEAYSKTAFLSNLAKVLNGKPPARSAKDSPGIEAENVLFQVGDKITYQAMDGSCIEAKILADRSWRAGVGFDLYGYDCIASNGKGFFAVEQQLIDWEGRVEK